MTSFAPWHQNVARAVAGWDAKPLHRGNQNGARVSWARHPLGPPGRRLPTCPPYSGDISRRFVAIRRPIGHDGGMRRTVEFAVLLIAAGLVVRTWYVQGLAVPFIVSGGSMAGTLQGLHRDVVCGDCGLAFACGSDARPVGARAVCPNCGYRHNDLESQPDVSGDRLLVDKSAFHLRPPP